jgi:hypothetical protein
MEMRSPCSYRRRVTYFIALALLLSVMGRSAGPAGAQAPMMQERASAPSSNQQDKSHLGGPASALVTFFVIAAPGTAQELQLVGPNGNLSDFTLPGDTVLIVTDLIVSVNLVPAPGVTRGGLLNRAGTGATNPYFAFDTTHQASQTIHLTGGARWSEMPRATNAPDSVNTVFMFIYGYLTKNQ